MAVTANLVKELREKTGTGMMDCKKALEVTGGDLEKAVVYLREQGVAQAAKKVGRATREGTIYAALAPDYTAGTMVEVNCETDFVARTAEFRALVEGIAREVSALDSDIASEKQLPVAEFLQRPLSSQDGRTVGDLLTEGIARLGENLGLKQFARFSTRAGLVFAYIHPGDKLGVLVELATPAARGPAQEHIRLLAKDVAMQTAAANPLVVSRAELPPDLTEKEKQIYRSQAVHEGKPEKVLNRIVSGKLEKYFQEVCLLEQPFVKDQDRMVREVIAETEQKVGEKITVRRFARFRLGE